MPKELQHWIGGRAVAGSSGQFGDVFNPATGHVVRRVPFAGAELFTRPNNCACSVRPAATSWGVSKMWSGGKSRSSASRSSM